ncbi:hypothetical protein Dsin_006313 [Dipteronia sinensis]|uniref:Uncharacterized protein n=1 Tax=Dipteronia sinensis TaxID=43782 RepID=A0AAE0AY69_9ROSI|nr:hypothetical protein Dsin_006313 [Dipteronia sinensis]
MGIKEIQDDGKVKVDMGEPVLKASEVTTRLPANKDQSVVKSELDVAGVPWNVMCQYGKSSLCNFWYRRRPVYPALGLVSSKYILRLPCTLQAWIAYPSNLNNLSFMASDTYFVTVITYAEFVELFLLPI